MDEQRIIDLELKISHQEVAIEELQNTVHEQGLAIAKLETTLKKLGERIEDYSSGANQVGPGNEKPPHY